MKERPILFSAPMVRALLAGTKTQTRRVCKAAALHALSAVVEVSDPLERGQVYNGSHFGNEEGGVVFASPYGGVGDRLWVREAWRSTGDGGRCNSMPPRDMQPHHVWYEADGLPPADECAGKLRPSMFMPRWASRLTLEVTEVRVERLQDISEADAVAEGIEQLASPHAGVTLYRDYAPGHDSTVSPVHSYETLWNSINGPGAWAANPWVWAVSFRRIETQAA